MKCFFLSTSSALRTNDYAIDVILLYSYTIYICRAGGAKGDDWGGFMIL